MSWWTALREGTVAGCLLRNGKKVTLGFCPFCRQFKRRVSPLSTFLEALRVISTVSSFCSKDHLIEVSAIVFKVFPGNVWMDMVVDMGDIPP